MAELRLGLVLVLGSITQKRDRLKALIHVLSLDTARELANICGLLPAKSTRCP
jgi:hypothetical protein